VREVLAYAYDAEAIDAATLAEIERQAGQAIQVVAFIELPEHSLEQMPVPPARGDVVLVTKNTRSGGGMVDVEHARANDSCGAKQAWIGNPS
jgi:hypothetical protein